MAVLLLLVFSICIATSTSCSEGIKFCAWEDWQTWSECTANCGDGSRIRTRDLCCSDAGTVVENCTDICNVHGLVPDFDLERCSSPCFDDIMNATESTVTDVTNVTSAADITVANTTSAIVASTPNVTSDPENITSIVTSTIDSTSSNVTSATIEGIASNVTYSHEFTEYNVTSATEKTISNVTSTTETVPFSVTSAYEITESNVTSTFETDATNVTSATETATSNGYFATETNFTSALEVNATSAIESTDSNTTSTTDAVPINITSASEVTETNVTSATDAVPINITSASEVTETNVTSATDAVPINITSASEVTETNVTSATEAVPINATSTTEAVPINATSATEAVPINVTSATETVPINVTSATKVTDIIVTSAIESTESHVTAATASIDPKVTFTTYSTTDVIAEKSCENSYTDVIFVVDGSYSIGEEDFQTIKQFMKQLINMFHIGEDRTRVAMIQYSDSAVLEFQLDDHVNLTDLLDAVDDVMYSGGASVTSDAIQLMRTVAFQGERPDAPDVAIVITDGLSKYPALTRNQAQLAKNEEITIFSIGIGNDTDKAELQSIASADKFMFQVGDYESLLALDGVVAHRACGVTLGPNHHVRTTTTTWPTSTDCQDISLNCTSYPRDACSDYPDFSRQNCARTCGYCSQDDELVEPPCEDGIDNCADYGKAMCFTQSEYLWVERHCRHYCGFCGDKSAILIPGEMKEVTTVPTTETPPCVDHASNCSDYASCGNDAYKSWNKQHCAKHCGFCFNYNIISSQTVNNSSCPAWKLPVDCSLDYATTDDECCPLPKCPDGFRLAVKRQ